jgi:hypothetical protein
MALIFTNAWREQKKRNHRTAAQILQEQGDSAVDYVVRRIELSRENRRDFGHWRRVLAHLKSMDHHQA